MQQRLLTQCDAIIDTLLLVVIISRNISTIIDGMIYGTCNPYLPIVQINICITRYRVPGTVLDLVRNSGSPPDDIPNWDGMSGCQWRNGDLCFQSVLMCISATRKAY